MRRTEMPLPMLRRCCWCLSLETGCLIMCILSTIACIANIVFGAWKLSSHHERQPEDNLISMSMIMFSTLSAISNIAALLGVILKRPGYLQLSIVFNSVFILCIFLVAVVTCLFRLSEPYNSPGIITLIVFLLLAGALYSLYYLTMINSLYRIMKMAYGDSAIPI